MYKKRSRRKQRIVNKINIYIHLILIIIIITIIILWEPFPARVVCVSGWCVLGGQQRLVKTFTGWQKLASWQELGAVSEAERYWGIFFVENNGRTAMAILDNLYIKCYNKRSDDNKKAICHQTVKFALYGVFAISAIISL